MKMLIYCTKSKSYLYKTEDTTYPAYPIGYHTDKDLKLKLSNTKELANLNGKIVAECDFEAEHLYNAYSPYRENDIHYFDTDTLNEAELIKRSRLSNLELENYFKNKNGYAIHIKNLNIFDKPRELFNYCGKTKKNVFYHIQNAPQNMMYCYGKNTGEKYILISIRPEWVCKILNGEKTIEVRKKVLKEMIK